MGDFFRKCKINEHTLDAKFYKKYFWGKRKAQQNEEVRFSSML